MADPPFPAGAVDLNKGLTPNKRIPPIAEPLSNVNSLAEVVKTLRQGMQSLAGFRGPVLDRAVTFRDLIDMGLFASTPETGSKAYRIALYVPGTPARGYVMLRFTATDIIIFPAGGIGSEATADVAGTAVYGIQVALGANAPNNFTAVGSVTFTASAVGVVSLTGDVILHPDDCLKVVCVSTDATIRDISLTLHGARR